MHTEAFAFAISFPPWTIPHDEHPPESVQYQGEAEKSAVVRPNFYRKRITCIKPVPPES
jgi:hypothetical protein